MRIKRDFIVFHFCSCLISFECLGLDCTSNSTKVYDGIGEFAIKTNDEFKEHRTKRASKPVTKFFDELLSKRLFNTTMNFIVPGAKVTLPRHTDEGSVDHLAMQAFFGIFWATAWLATIAIPVATTYFQPLGIARSFHEDKMNRFKFKWKLTQDVADAIGLDWESCIQKSVCQAHKFPDKYGILGKSVQVLFPADDKLEYDMTKQTTFREAALQGAIGQDCTQIYNCFFDVLDVIVYLAKYCSATL